MRYVLAIIWTVVILTLGVYDGPANSGVYLNAFGHCVGIEITGVPGPWLEVDCQ